MSVGNQELQQVRRLEPSFIYLTREFSHYPVDCPEDYFADMLADCPEDMIYFEQLKDLRV